MTGEPFPPWLEGNWRRLMDRLARGRFPHALLFAGAPGLGKGLFARRLSQAILCHDRGADGAACQACQSCLLFKAGSHPDFREVAPLEDKTIIAVDQIREVGDFLSLKSQYGPYRFIGIAPADQMNENAANSLLKTLEEPPEGTVLMLISANPARISATIRSRCQKITFTPPDRESALAWLRPRLPASSREEADVLLALANGAPLAALALAQGDLMSKRHSMLEDIEQIFAKQADPVVIADKWLKLGAKASLYWLYTWLVDMARLGLADTAPHLANPDFREDLIRLSITIDMKDVLSNIGRVEKAILQLEGQVNQQLLLEDLLIACQMDRRNEMRLTP